jgi:hypothetical protein
MQEDSSASVSCLRSKPVHRTDYLLVDGVLLLGDGVVPAAGVLCAPGEARPPLLTAPVPPELAPAAVPVVPLVPDEEVDLLVSELLDGVVAVAEPDAEPMPDDDPEVVPEALGPVDEQAASTKAQAKGMIHLVM